MKDKIFILLLLIYGHSALFYSDPKTTREESLKSIDGSKPNEKISVEILKQDDKKVGNFYNKNHFC